MKTVVPIHNAVNERAWSEILEWKREEEVQRMFVSQTLSNRRCGGPRLVSFKGDSTKLSPRARMNTWLGYCLLAALLIEDTSNLSTDMIGL